MTVPYSDDVCGCGQPLDDGEGWDGRCGNCADLMDHPDDVDLEDIVGPPFTPDEAVTAHWLLTQIAQGRVFVAITHSTEPGRPRYGEVSINQGFGQRSLALRDVNPAAAALLDRLERT
jgi:hypothetical protein